MIQILQRPLRGPLQGLLHSPSKRSYSRGTSFFIALIAMVLVSGVSLPGGAWAAPPSSSSADGQSDTSCRFPAELAAQLLRGDVSFGDLSLSGQFVVNEQLLLDQGRLQATVEGQLDVGPLRLQRQATLCVFLLLNVDGEAILAHQQRIDVDDFSTVESVRYVLRADLPEGTRHMTLVAREAESGFWGAAPLETPGGEIAGPSFTARRVEAYEGTYYELTHRQGGGGGAVAQQPSSAAPSAPPAPPAAGSGGGAAPTPQSPQAVFPKVRVPGQRPGPPRDKLAGEQILRLVPPRNEPVSGSTVFNVLTSTVAVDKVVFELDGTVVDEDGRPPFRKSLPLARPAREQVVRVIAYDSLGVVMAEDSIRVNQLDRPFRVRITDFKADPSGGSVSVKARATVPPQSQLAKMEVWLNDRLIGSYDGPEVEVGVPTPNIQPTDFLRVAAFLADGSSIDDVLLLAEPDVEEVDVNLVELFAVVSDANGSPVEDLTAADFTVVYENKERETANFAYADDVPLVLGLLVDTSGSMQMLMHDTRRAAAKFLGQTIKPQDKAFLVDFDLQPRLVHDVTGDLPSLMRSLGKLNADGATAMFDAVVFSLLQFERHPGRRALVVLTDGDDIDSRYGPKHCAEMARQTGVPVYVIGLGALDTLRRTFSKRDLRRLTEETGGRLYFVESFEELAQAYAQINAELRSQYSLGFYVEEDLSDEQKRKVEVKVPRGMTARTVIGAGRLSDGS